MPRQELGLVIDMADGKGHQYYLVKLKVERETNRRVGYPVELLGGNFNKTTSNETDSAKSGQNQRPPIG